MADERVLVDVSRGQDRLEVLFPRLDSVVVEGAGGLAHTELTDCPVRDVLPVLVECA